MWAHMWPRAHATVIRPPARDARGSYVLLSWYILMEYSFRVFLLKYDNIHFLSKIYLNVLVF